MQKLNDKGQEYIDAFPKLKKWINVCICCGRKGYKPDTPDKIGAYEYSFAGSNIKKYFKPLDVNEYSLCKTCAKLLKQNNK